MQIRFALPKGRLLNDTAALTKDWGLSDYSEGARLYHLTSSRFPDMAAKILHEKDIPIQVALGNYDMGICGLDWIQELLAKFPESNLVKVRDLGFGAISLFLATNQNSNMTAIADFQASDKVVGIASEYPNIAESIALNTRLKRYNIYPVWGAVEIYPPENADMVLLSCKPGDKLGNGNLISVTRIMDSNAYLIANKNSWENKDLSEVLQTIYANAKSPGLQPVQISEPAPVKNGALLDEKSIRFAMPDGHQQRHVANIFTVGNIKITDYPSSTGNRRPQIEIPNVTIKVIRPQDMPLQVANGKFDVAITGKDWVREHLFKFPSSPIKELVDLKYGWVRIVAAVHNDVPVENIAQLRQWAAEKNIRLRVATEYIAIADKYARDNHLGMYRIVPTWGATEAFLPDDAELLIENTETGGTLKRHNLKIIDTLFESTACFITNTNALNSAKAGTINSIADMLNKAVLAVAQEKK